ncbi:Tryptophan synthase alpha chain [Minicystis rosea]|nr:Tryptophan synthase alpha chain [Minicystis rosea]
MLLGGVVSAAAAACAQGQQLTGVGGNAGGPGVGGSTTSSGAAGGKPDAGNGEIGSPCKSNADCTEGSCSPIGNGSYCTQPCPPDCPFGTYCTVINGTSLCAPDLDQQCTKCSSNTDCKLPSDQCLTAPLGDKFCARDCSVDGVCPNGFTCVDKAAYAGDGGVPEGGTDAGDAGMPVSTAFKWCVPNGGSSCPCNQKRDDVARACSVKNQYGNCNGMETCDGKQGKWDGCTAATPAAETCNGKDDNCNGMADDGDQNALCAASGPKPPHASWACKNATCSLGACDPGWTSYPAGPASVGCGCQVETGEPNGSCGTATNAGSVSDTGAPITIQGTLSSAADVDFWSFDTVDVNEGSTNSYHVRINFTAPATNSEFLMDVIRGDTCTDTPTGAATSIVAYDWCVNGFNGVDTGEAPCGPTASVHCGGLPGSGVIGTHSSKYYIRVFRKPGATGTCTQYSLSVSAAAGACDFAQKCASP